MADARKGAVIVTGAAGGLGRAITDRVAAQGLSLALGDVDGGRLREQADRLASGGAAVVWRVGDLAREEDARALVALAIERLGGVWALINNAGGGVIRPFLDHDDASIAETLTRNLMTTITCARAVLPVLVEQGRGGRIVNVGAESVRNGLLDHALYNAAKGGVHGLTSGLAREFAAHGITVNCVAPSIIATDEVRAAMAAPARLPEHARVVLEQAIALIPMGRPATVDEVASTVSFLVSEEASFITGQVISVNGGSSMG